MLNRTFFALTLSKPQKALIEQWRDENIDHIPKTNQATQVSAANLHLNLAFLGNLTEEQIESVFKLVENIKFNPIEIEINSVSYWEEKEILWIGAQEQNAQFLRLSNEFKKIGQALNLEMDENTYTPHISLYRNCQPQSLNTPAPDFCFSFDTVVLFQTLTLPHSVDYHIIRHWKATQVSATE